MEFDVIVADPPWAYQNWTDAKNGAAVSAMAVQGEEFLSRLRVGDLYAARDAVLLCWFTWPKMIEGECSRVVNAWGFEGVTGAPWVKTLPKKEDIATGIGFWFQSCSEPLTVWRRGKPTAQRYPVLGLLAGDERQFYYPASRKHSNKPEDIYDWIEKLCGPPGDGSDGTTRYLELFATRNRPGWACWGADLGHWLDHNGVRVMTPEEAARYAAMRGTLTLPPPPPSVMDGTTAWLIAGLDEPEPISRGIGCSLWPSREAAESANARLPAPARGRIVSMELPWPLKTCTRLVLTDEHNGYAYFELFDPEAPPPGIRLDQVTGPPIAGDAWR